MSHALFIKLVPFICTNFLTAHGLHYKKHVNAIILTIHKDTVVFSYFGRMAEHSLEVQSHAMLM